MTEETPQETMIRLAADAVVYAKDIHEIELDYSLQSLDALEKIVATLHAHRAGWIMRMLGQAPSVNETKMVAAMLGGYAGEVFRKAKGGEWRLEETTGACGVALDGVWIFPIQRIHVQLNTGRASDYVSPLPPSQLSR